MHRSIRLFPLALLALAAANAEEALPATFVDKEKVAEVFTKGGALASGQGYRASGARRTGPGQVEVHVKETDIFYITEGEATFVTGGKMIDGKQSQPNQFLGKDIEGGVVHQLKKGDFIVIPAGTPHWFKAVPQSVTYYMVKVIQP
jgi:mannose-6-phosphate isomerase-like protein (cupin superfamily)